MDVDFFYFKDFYFRLIIGVLLGGYFFAFFLKCMLDRGVKERLLITAIFLGVMLLGSRRYLVGITFLGGGKGLYFTIIFFVSYVTGTQGF